MYDKLTHPLPRHDIIWFIDAGQQLVASTFDRYIFCLKIRRNFFLNLNKVGHKQSQIFLLVDVKFERGG